MANDGAKGRTVVVTGGAQGIGRAIALAAAGHGAAVAVVDRSAPDLEAVGAELHEATEQAVLIEADASDPDGVEAALDEAEQRLGPLYGLVNNVGVNPAGETPVERIEPALWDATMKLTVGACFLGSRAAVPRMRAAGGGRIVNIASIVASRALPEIAAYNAAKAAVVSLTQTLALEVALDEILVNAIAPGHVMTENARKKFTPEFLAHRESAIPAGRHGDPEEIARAAVFLLFDCRWMTGVTLPVDGGMSAATLRAL